MDKIIYQKQYENDKAAGLAQVSVLPIIFIVFILFNNHIHISHVVKY
jgi:hypothetical protein